METFFVPILLFMWLEDICLTFPIPPAPIIPGCCFICLREDVPETPEGMSGGTEPFRMAPCSAQA